MNRISKSETKYYSSLNQKKFRRETGLFSVEGKRLVSELMVSGLNIEKFIVTDNFAENESIFVNKLTDENYSVLLAGENDFSRIADTQSPQGIIAIVNVPQARKADELVSSQIVALTDISDPGNLGTILRTCNWFGFNSIIVDEKCAEIYNPKVVRASMGAIFHSSPVVVEDMLSTLAELKGNGYEIITADLDGNNLFKTTPGEKFVIIFANEAHGPAPEITKLSDRIFTIPQFGKVESLNVASAAAVMLSHFKSKV